MSPVPDTRMRDEADGYQGMHALVAELVLPDGASMYVMSALETSRELIRHSYHRYEFATVAVTHALFALEQVLAERLAGESPLRELIERATAAGLVTAALGAELERALHLRDRIAHGEVTSAACTPLGAVTMVRGVFDAVSMLLQPASVGRAGHASVAGTVGGNGAQSDDGLPRLWEEHLQAPYPESFRGVDFDGVALILLDADVAGLVRRELGGGLDGEGIAVLWACIAELDKVVPLLDEEYCASYFGRLRVMAGLVGARRLPAAT
ncbi:hypothetical protein [Streptomyces aureus]|uniref:hypothetical protein n=1 Tax=Streptomyces aureus TaxID=193461 RepID=UPI001FD75E6D|nr:hypothetical protein [Streptomyces aureus]